MKFIEEKAIPVAAAHLKAYHAVQNRLGPNHSESFPVVEQLTLNALAGGHSSCLGKGAPHTYLNSVVENMLQYLIHPVRHPAMRTITRAQVLTLPMSLPPAAAQHS